MYLTLFGLALAGDVPLPPVIPPGCSALYTGPVLHRPMLLRPEDWPIVQVGNPTGDTLYVAAIGLDEAGDPVSCDELGPVPALGAATFDVGDLPGPLVWMCSTACEVIVEE